MAGVPFTKHHTTSQTYLREWQSGGTKDNEMCWTFPVVSQTECGPPEEKLIRNIMWEPDFYTLYNPDGSRNLDYEQKVFGQAEQLYGTMRPFFTTPQELLKNKHRKALARFTAYQVLKTPSMLYAYFERLKSITTSLEENGLSSSDRLMLQMTGPGGTGRNYTVAEAKKLLLTPFESLIVPTLDRMLKAVMKMKLRLVAFPSPVLITSDTPAIVWMQHVGVEFVGMRHSASEIWMPLSPKLLAVFNWQTENLVNGTDAGAMAANVMRVRNARSLLVGYSDAIAPAIFTSSHQFGHNHDFVGVRGHLDPIPDEVWRIAPFRAEAWGEGTGTVRSFHFPDGTVISDPLPPGKASPGQ